DENAGALAFAQRYHFALVLGKRRIQFRRHRVGIGVRVAGAEQQDVAVAGRDAGVHDPLHAPWRQVVLDRLVVRAPQNTGTPQNAGDVARVQPREIGLTPVLGQVVPGDPDRPVVHVALTPPRSAARILR